MNRTQSLDRVSDALEDGLLADQVLLAIARSEAGKSVTEVDKRALQTAIKFLKSARKGYEWLDKPVITEESRSWASSFEMAVRAIHRKNEFLENLDNLLKAANNLKNRKIVPPNEVKSLREFFGRMVRASIDLIDESSASSKTEDLNWALSSL